MSGNSVELSFRFRGKTYADPQQGWTAFAAALQQGLVVAGSALSRELQLFLQRTVQTIAARNSQRFPSSGDGLASRSGALINSLKAGVRITGATLATLHGELHGIFYTQIQERGGTITATGARFLAIPLPPAMNADGTPKQDSPRDWDNTFVARSRRGNLLIFQKRGTEIIPLYILKRQVTLRPRLGAREAFRSGLPYFVSRAVDVISSELRAA